MCSYHAGAAAVVAVLHLGSRLIPLAITALTGVHDVHSELLVDTLGSLIECQFHDVLKMRHVLSLCCLRTCVKACSRPVLDQEGTGQYLQLLHNYQTCPCTLPGKNGSIHLVDPALHIWILKCIK